MQAGFIFEFDSMLNFFHTSSILQLYTIFFWVYLLHSCQIWFFMHFQNTSLFLSLSFSVFSLFISLIFNIIFCNESIYFCRKLQNCSSQHTQVQSYLYDRLLQIQRYNLCICCQITFIWLLYLWQFFFVCRTTFMMHNDTFLSKW
jgi:hypothetical protein